MLYRHARILHRTHGKRHDERATRRLPSQYPPAAVYQRLLSRRLRFCRRFITARSRRTDVSASAKLRLR